ncbi:MAG: type III-A CRISPR-associated RAMP protein Csm4 [bacterium]|jgi:CRISPR-associated protein Csm4
MPIYRILIEPRSLQITPWQADTLFGSLCWAYRHRYGESALQEFLQPFLSGEPSFLLSDGIAEGHLPLPYYLRILPVDVNDTQAYQKSKLLKKVRLLPEAEFRKACAGESVQVNEDALQLQCHFSQMHASINRMTGTTRAAEEDEGGNLYQLEGFIPNPAGSRLAVYVNDRNGDMITTVFELFRDMEMTGFGKKKSSGAGAFRVVGEAETWQPPQVQNPDGFVSLSGFVPRQSDPAAGFWQLRVKHGKLGESYATGGKSPFKIPWVVLESGSCFYTASAPGEVYGRMLTGLSRDYPGVVQYGYAFPVPIAFPASIIEVAS